MTKKEYLAPRLVKLGTAAEMTKTRFRGFYSRDNHKDEKTFRRGGFDDCMS